MSVSTDDAGGWPAIRAYMDRSITASTYAALASMLAFVASGLVARGLNPMIVVFAVSGFFVAFLHALVIGVPYAWLLQRFGYFRRIPMMLGGATAGMLPNALLGASVDQSICFGVLGVFGAWASHAAWMAKREEGGAGVASPLPEAPAPVEPLVPTRVYYNSACPVCRTGIGMQQGAMGACEIEWIDVHENPEAVRELGIDIEAVRERLHVRDAEGVKVGADAAAVLWSRTCGLRWASRLLSFPLIRAWAQRAYAVFARWLYRWNRRHGRW